MGGCRGLGFDDGLNPCNICQQFKRWERCLLEAMLRHKSSLREGRIHVCSHTPFHFGHRNAFLCHPATYPTIPVPLSLKALSLVFSPGRRSFHAAVRFGKKYQACLVPEPDAPLRCSGVPSHRKIEICTRGSAQKPQQLAPVNF